MGMTVEEHKERHRILHQQLDELFADYISHHPDEINFLQMPLKKLLDWSYQQTLEPTEKEKTNENSN